jgi:hypothetical protein
MTEAEWLVCEDWRPMLAFLSSRWTQRKALLYVCAGLRSLWELLYDEGSQGAVEVAERAADGVASDNDIDEASYYAETPTFGYDFDGHHIRTWNDGPGVQRLIQMGVYSREDALRTDGELGDEQTRSRLFNAAHIAYHALVPLRGESVLDEHLLEHLSSQKEWPGGRLVREIVGNPLRPVTVDPLWLSWNDNIVLRLSQAAYDDRILPTGTLDNTRLFILADALEEAGCTDVQILTHLRGGGEHYRGCWVIDLLLGKQ